jgi:uncharacterized membrane protein YcaP (DUF421 family)
VSALFRPDIPLWTIVLRSLIVYAAIVAGTRLAGTRLLGQMSVPDFVLLLLVSNAACADAAATGRRYGLPGRTGAQFA